MKAHFPEMILRFDSAKTPGYFQQLTVDTLEKAVVIAATDSAHADELAGDLRELLARVEALRYRLWIQKSERDVKNTGIMGA